MFEAWVRGTGKVLEQGSPPPRLCELCSYVARRGAARWSELVARADGTSHGLLRACDEPSNRHIYQAVAPNEWEGVARCFFPRMSFFLRAFCTLPRPPSVQVRLLPTDDRWEKSRLTRETISSSSLFSVHPGLHDPSFTGSPVFCLFSPPFGIGN